MQVQLDYRNAKYQGQMDNQTGSKNGHGILVDDDLSLYASQWVNDKLNGATVIYISHGKYIYGIWKDNEPHGLNVFRIGDTVILGEFNNGQLINKVLIIFQKFNFIAIIEQNNEDDQWSVIESGTLKNYDELLRYIHDAKLPMKQHFFSLVKFLTSISNNRIVTVPCRTSENCYFGFQEGLGIVFNPNNGVVTIGMHCNRKLIEFGGKYEIPNYVIQGNFQTNETIRYKKQRPDSQIYSIFQKMHKRSLSFKNQYFDSKVKLFTGIEDLIRSKLQEIVNDRRRNGNNRKSQTNFSANDLNESLDYHAETLQEINRMYKIREQVYESNKIPLKKATSKYVQQSPKPLLSSKSSSKLNQHKTSKKSSMIINAPASPLTSMPRTKSNNNLQISKSPNRASTRNLHKNSPKFQQSDSKTPVSQFSVSRCRTPPRQRNQNRSPIRQKDNRFYQDNIVPQSKHQTTNIASMNISSKQYVRQKEKYDVPVFNYQPNINTQQYHIPSYKKMYEQKYNKYSVNKKSSNSPLRSKQQGTGQGQFKIRGPQYQDLSQRRKRLLRQFKDLSKSGFLQQQTNTRNRAPSLNTNARSRINNRNQQDRINRARNNEINNYEQDVESPLLKLNKCQPLDSPYNRQKFYAFESKNNNNSSRNFDQNMEMLPLSIRNNNVLNKNEFKPINNLQYTLNGRNNKFNENYSPILAIGSNYNNTNDKSSGKYSYGIGQKLQQNEPIVSSPKLYHQSSCKEEYLNKPFQKKQSYHEDNKSYTPSKRKTYKYYFD